MELIYDDYNVFYKFDIKFLNICVPASSVL